MHGVIMKNLHNFFNIMIHICGPDCLENLGKSKIFSLHDPTATIIFRVA